MVPQLTAHVLGQRQVRLAYDIQPRPLGEPVAKIIPYVELGLCMIHSIAKIDLFIIEAQVFHRLQICMYRTSKVDLSPESPEGSITNATAVGRCSMLANVRFSISFLSS